MTRNMESHPINAEAILSSTTSTFTRGTSQKYLVYVTQLQICSATFSFLQLPTCTSLSRILHTGTQPTHLDPSFRHFSSDATQHSVQVQRLQTYLTAPRSVGGFLRRSSSPKRGKACLFCRRSSSSIHTSPLRSSH